MGKRHPNHRLVKRNRTYSVEEVTRLFDLHPNTVRAWMKQGLEPLDRRRPILFQGDVLAAFLERRRAAGKRPCKPGEIYCIPCRAARRPAGDMVDYVATTTASGTLRAICPVCGRLMYRRVSLSRLHDVVADLDLTIAQASPRLSETGSPFVMCDSAMEIAT